MKTTNSKNMLELLNNSSLKMQTVDAESNLSEKDFKHPLTHFSAAQLWSIQRNRRIPGKRRLTCI